MKNKFDHQNSFGWLVNVIAHQASKEFEKRLKEHGLTVALWPTLFCLWTKEGLLQREIAEISKVENSTTTRTLDKLEKLKLIERKTDPNSRRSFRIYLTDRGRELESELVALPHQVNQKLLAKLSDSEREQLMQILQKLVEDV